MAACRGSATQPLHHLIEPVAAAAGALAPLVSVLADGLVGIVAGALVLAGVMLVKRLRG